MFARPFRASRVKPVFWITFAAMTVYVILRWEVPLLDSRSPAWQHFTPVKWWLLPHGVAGALALLIGPFQFSNRLRSLTPRLHRILGRSYIVSVFISAPVAILIAVIQGPTELIGAATIQSFGWVLTTAIALYCARTGNLAQHREWMMRSYPFAMVFVVTRVFLAVPAIQETGESGLVTVVWASVAAACFCPSIVIEWRSVFRRPASAQGH